MNSDGRNVARAQKFKIGFGRFARAIVCEDDIGNICFTFDISSAGDDAEEKWKLDLDPRPLTLQGENFEPLAAGSEDRVAAALEEAKTYAASKGYLI